MKLLWDQSGQRTYETGVDQGVLYIPANGVYGPGSGKAWNGLTTVTESPDGAEANAIYADNMMYLNLISAENFKATIEAYTYPDEFAQCDGSLQPSPGVSVGQQTRKAFGLSYRTRVGNDVDSADYGYKLHLVYNATTAPSEKAYATINDSPEAITLSWEISTVPIPITQQVNGVTPKPTAILTIDSTKVDATALAALEAALYGDAGADARLPLPDEVITMFAGTVSQVTPTVPSFTSPDITIPTVTGVQYRRADTNAVVTGTVTVGTTTGDKLVIYAVPTAGYAFPPNVDDDWQYTRT